MPPAGVIPIGTHLESVSFRIFTSDEVKQLSVLEIKYPHGIDQKSAQPLVEGLSDNRLGPLDRNELCQTCNLSDIDCPGHFGHINLSVPVYNPFLVRQMFQLLNMTCFSCYRFRLDPVPLQIILCQFEALQYGLDHLVDSFTTDAACILQSVDQDKFDSLFSLAEYVGSQLKSTLRSEIARLQNEIGAASGLPSTAKTVSAKKIQLMRGFLTAKLVKAPRGGICPHEDCKARRPVISLITNSHIIQQQNLGRNARAIAKKRAQSEVSEDRPDLGKLVPTIGSGIQNDEEVILDVGAKRYLNPDRAREILKNLWQNEATSLSRILCILDLPVNPFNPESKSDEGSVSSPMDIFFLTVLPVPPNRFRPLQFQNGRKYQHERTDALSKIMIQSQEIHDIFEELKKLPNGPTKLVKERNLAIKCGNAWQRLQILSNRLYDSDMDRLTEKGKITGVRQLLEKKEGLFRKHMMGKRVNYAARSVISPDPYISVDEIGLPVIFAKVLTYPTPVTRWNLRWLRRAVLNGPSVHPGATSVQMEDGRIFKLRDEMADFRKFIADKLGDCNTCPSSAPKIVHRHLVSGDVLLLNRQPTLHKPSIMALKARVMPNERTLRLHYANCKTFNADFDGDEMNAHFPQSELGRAEAYQIATVNQQFLVPKDGSPLSGLIQDHIIGGALLSARGVFFNREDYHALVYFALSFLNRPIRLLRPAILKPRTLWSGKQIASTIILNCLPEGAVPPNVSTASKISSNILKTTMRDLCESQVIIREGQLLCGFIDKVSIGPTHFGLVHMCYELYGGETSSALLTAFARLCTNYLQSIHGFTLGIADVLVRDEANQMRVDEISKCAAEVGNGVVAQVFNIPNCHEEEIIKDRFQDAHVNQSDLYMKKLDQEMKGHTNDVTSRISAACLGDGLIKPFPANNLQLMIQAGAKGGTVNALQISCLLGQIELEGRRVPLQLSGRTLPSFRPYDTSPRAGGFVAGRFMTGIRPQEFFFHCMAGREGLIDTAVKTSRSGYLQRCLIKHLEGLVIHYDMTVRDSDGSVIQFLYGEDGIDVLKSQLLCEKQFSAIIQNRGAIEPKNEEIAKLKAHASPDIAGHKERISTWNKRNGNIPTKETRISPFSDYLTDRYDQIEKRLAKESGPTSVPDVDKVYNGAKAEWMAMTQDERNVWKEPYARCPDPVISVFQPNRNFKSISERMESVIKSYSSRNPDNLIGDEGKGSLSKKHFKNLISYRTMRSLADPGEAVGLIASQSVGEPSTQMTLNTFHFAGRGEMNVTLGIPRLREILMTASSQISTPSMEIPFKTDVDHSELSSEAPSIVTWLNSVRVSDVLESVDIEESLLKDDYSNAKRQVITFNFLPRKFYKGRLNASPHRILDHFEAKFIRLLMMNIAKKIRDYEQANNMFDHSGKREYVKRKIGEEEAAGEGQPSNTKEKTAEEEAESSDEEAEGDGDTLDTRHKNKHLEEKEYEEPEADEKEVDEDDGFDEVNETDALADDDDALSQNASADEGDEEAAEDDVDILDTVHSATSASSAGRGALTDQQLEFDKADRVKRVLSISNSIVDYDFDTRKKQRWSRLVLRNEVAHNFDLSVIINETASKCVIHKVGSISRAFLVKDMEASSRGASFDRMIKTEGVESASHFLKYDKYLDLNRIYSNDVHAIANTYGIEAANRCIHSEVKSVFGAYGITVDNRHLTLIADYMTSEGKIRGMNRAAMEFCPSPIQQMTFETTATFLRQATLSGLKDDLTSPSARIVAGKVPIRSQFELISSSSKMPFKPVIEEQTVKRKPFKKRLPASFKRKADELVKAAINKRIKFAETSSS